MVVCFRILCYNSFFTGVINPLPLQPKVFVNASHLDHRQGPPCVARKYETWVKMERTLAYYDMKLITAVKSFIT